MGITEQEAIKELQTRDEIFVAYSQATKLPYVICDQESFNDQVWVFATEEEIKAFGKKKLEDKILLMGMKYEKKDYPRFYGTLYAIGVNSVVWVDGENQIEVELTRIARQADFSQLEPKKQPLFNSTLQLSGIYFMQEPRQRLTFHILRTNRGIFFSRLLQMLWNLINLQEARSFGQPRFHLPNCQVSLSTRRKHL